MLTSFVHTDVSRFLPRFTALQSHNPRSPIPGPQSLIPNPRTLLLHAFLERLADVRILPFDDRLRSQLLDVLLEFRLALVGEHALADLLARLVERKHLRRGHRVQLQQLVAAGDADRLADVARLHFLDHLAQVWCDVVDAQRADQPAVRLRRRIGELAGQPVEGFAAGRHAPADVLRFGQGGFVRADVDAFWIGWRGDEDL